MQKLWLAKLGWDEVIPQNLITIWRQFCNNLHHINDIRIPRHVITSEYKTVELHAFCDTCERAYGACVYIRCCNKSGQYSLVQNLELNQLRSNQAKGNKSTFYDL